MDGRELTKGMLMDTTLIQATIKGAVNLGMSERQIIEATGLDAEVVRRAMTEASPTELIAEVEATLPAKLMKIASLSTDELLKEGKISGMSGPELARLITYCLHNARLMQNKSTANVSTISHYLHKINQKPLPSPMEPIEISGRKTNEVSQITGDVRKSYDPIPPEDPTIGLDFIVKNQMHKEVNEILSPILSNPMVPITTNSTLIVNGEVQTPKKFKKGDKNAPKKPRAQATIATSQELKPDPLYKPIPIPEKSEGECNLPTCSARIPPDLFGDDE